MGGEVLSLDAARKRRTQQEARASEQLLSKQRLAEALGVSPRTIDRWAEKGMPVALRLWGGSGAPRYQLSACVEWHTTRH